MSTATASFAPEWGTFRNWHNGIAWLLVALLGLLWLAGYGPGGAACGPGLSSMTTPAARTASPAPTPTTPPPSATASTAAAPVIAAAPAVLGAAKPATLPPAAKVYFALDKFELPTETDRTLSEVVTYLKANGGAKAIIAGFHDPSGNRAHNEELALNRARSVRSALESAGISNSRVVMQKPVETTGTGEAREARRVEVGVQP